MKVLQVINAIYACDLFVNPSSTGSFHSALSCQHRICPDYNLTHSAHVTHRARYEHSLTTKLDYSNSILHGEITTFDLFIIQLTEMVTREAVPGRERLQHSVVEKNLRMCLY